MNTTSGVIVFVQDSYSKMCGIALNNQRVQ